MPYTEPSEDLRVYTATRDCPPMRLDRTRHYDQTKRRDKPDGLWFSVQDDWDRWVRGEGMSWTSERLVHKVVIKPFEDLLRITSAQEMDEFTQKYLAPLSEGSWRRRVDLYPETYAIDWTAVAADYPGIVIYPYLWERRLGFEASWYYCWDCASGCVWDLDLVRCVIPIFRALPSGDDDET